MSEVYEATATDLERRVAIKRLIIVDGQEEEYEAQFMREAAVVATLDHPNVVGVVDVGQYGSDFFLVMELIVGISVAELIDALGRSQEALDLDLICGIVGQVARGLGHAHDRTLPDGTALAIVHRDISPENILINEDGVPKLIDFGVATLAGHAITQPGTVRGRPRYLAPEQARAQDVDPRTDVFALGAVMFELLCGEHLYPGDNEAAVLWRVQSGEYDPIAPRLPDVDKDLVAIIERACDPNPDKRFRSAREFERQLDAFRAARGLRFDSTSLAAVVRHVRDDVRRRRKKTFGSKKGELQGALLALPADPDDRATDPAAPAVTERLEKQSERRKRKKRPKRLRRISTPKLDRPPSLAKPKRPAITTGWFEAIRKERPGTSLWIVGFGVLVLGLVIALFVWLS